MPAYKDKNGKWFVKFQYKDWTGETKTKLKRGFNKKKDALDFERTFILSYARTADIPFSVLAERYLEARKGTLKFKTQKLHEIVLSSATSAIDDKPIKDITIVDIVNLRTSLLETRKPVTVNKYINIVKSVLQFGVDAYGLASNPCNTLRLLQEEKPQKRFVTVEEEEKIKSALKPDMKVLVDILFWTGIRVGEAIALTVSDIHPTYISVFKTEVTVGGETRTQQGLKNNSGRNVMIHNSLYEEIKGYIDSFYEPTPDTQLFPRKYDSYSARLKTACRKVGVEGVTPHCFRHSHVAMLIHKGYSPKVIADRIGDTVSTMLDTYAHVYPEDVTALIEDLEQTCINRVSTEP